MNSAFYSGWVRHRRLRPKAHEFRYRIGLLYLDLAEQDALFALSPLLGRGRFAPLSFRERDYLPHLTGQGLPLLEAVRQSLSEALGAAPEGRICLLTQPRCWGLSFNPVSFFYCFDAEERLAAILCEVSNTPWHQRYHYVLPADGAGSQHFAVAKSFHVSPFLPRNLEYHLHFSRPSERLGVHMEDHDVEGKLFDATLTLQRQTLDRAAVHRHLRAFPWMTAKTVLGIYWQALRLALKRVPFFSHRAADGHSRVAHRLQESCDEKL